MVDWQITAATFRCDTVGDEVTLLVYKDWSIKCTGYMKHAANGKLKKTGQTHICEGTECRLAVEYRNKLQAEEAKKTTSPKPVSKI
jgi:hypothetical protein